jgi:hypothetical protein
MINMVLSMKMSKKGLAMWQKAYFVKIRRQLVHKLCNLCEFFWTRRQLQVRINLAMQPGNIPGPVRPVDGAAAVDDIL